MLFRCENGNIIEIKRKDYSNDKLYYSTIMNSICNNK